MRCMLALVAIAACTPVAEHSVPTATVPVAATGVYLPPPELKKLRFGLIPYLSKQTIRRGHEPMGEYLSKSLNVPVDLVIADSYGDAINRLEKGEFDLVELSPYAFAQAERRVKLRCLAQSILNGSATTTGYIVVRDDSPIRTLGQLKGSQFAFVDPSSTAGYLYAAKSLRDNGIDPKRDFATVDFLGNHEAVLLAVFEGRVDAGATYQGAFHALQVSKGIDPLSFRVIGKTPRMPNDVLCVPASTPGELGDAIARAVLSLSSRSHDGRAVLGPLNMNGYQAADDSTFDGVRRIAAEVGPP